MINANVMGYRLLIGFLLIGLVASCSSGQRFAGKKLASIKVREKSMFGPRYQERFGYALAQRGKELHLLVTKFDAQDSFNGVSDPQTVITSLLVMSDAYWDTIASVDDFIKYFTCTDEIEEGKTIFYYYKSEDLKKITRGLGKIKATQAWSFDFSTKTFASITEFSSCSYERLGD